MGTLMLLLGVSQGILVFQKYLMWRCKKHTILVLCVKIGCVGGYLRGRVSFEEFAGSKLQILDHVLYPTLEWHMFVEKPCLSFRIIQKIHPLAGPYVHLFSRESTYLQNVCCSVKRPLVQQWTEHARNAWYFPPIKFGSLESSPSLRDLVWWMMFVTQMWVWFHWDVRDGAILDILNHPHSFGCLASFGDLSPEHHVSTNPST